MPAKSQSPEPKRISAEELEAKFDRGEDISAHLDLDSAFVFPPQRVAAPYRVGQRMGDGVWCICAPTSLTVVAEFAPGAATDVERLREIFERAALPAASATPGAAAPADASEPVEVD